MESFCYYRKSKIVKLALYWSAGLEMEGCASRHVDRVVVLLRRRVIMACWRRSHLLGRKNFLGYANGCTEGAGDVGVKEPWATVSPVASSQQSHGRVEFGEEHAKLRNLLVERSDIMAWQLLWIDGIHQMSVRVALHVVVWVGVSSGWQFMCTVSWLGRDRKLCGLLCLLAEDCV